MIRNKINATDKRSNLDSNSEFQDDQNESTHQPKQQKPSQYSETATTLESSPQSSSKSISFPNNRSGHHFYSNNATSISFQAKESSQIKRDEQSEQDRKFFNLPSSSDLSQSWKNAFQISNMASLPDYLPQLPSVSMPSMPNIPIPNFPSIPTLTMPSMPNLSMPNISMPSIPNINFPSISDFIPFLGKNIKTWDQICSSVKESRKKYTSICPSLPFNFNFCYDTKHEKLRFYFLSSINSSETTLYYCDVNLLKESSNNYHNKNEDNEALLNYFEESSRDSFNEINSINHRKISINENHHEKFKPSNSQSNLENNFDIADCDYDVDNNISSSSPTSMTLSSSNSNDSYIQTSIDPSILRKSITLPTSSISNLETIEWKQLIKINTNFGNGMDETINNIPSSTISPNNKKINFSACKSTSSQEEDLILQRKRILINGIFSYDFHPKMARFVFTMKNAIYWFDDIEMTKNYEDFFKIKTEYSCDNQINKVDVMNDEKLSPINLELIGSSYFPPYVPQKLITNDYVKLNATICPDMPDLVAYTADNDLWVCDLVSGCEIRLTNTCYSKTSIMAGRPSFVMQEEFSRFTGFWWRPSGNNHYFEQSIIFNSEQDYRNVYTILCEFVDESMVESISISSWDGMNEIHRFPKAGSINAKSSLKLVHFFYNSISFNSIDKKQLRLLKIEDLRVKFESIFPEYEYLIRCDWLDDDVIWAQLLNRKQNRLVIVLLSISNRFPLQIIHDEFQKDHWYNCHEIIYFHKDKPSNKNDDENDPNYDGNNIINVGSRVEFLWSSEISGFRHLYKISIEIVDYPSRKDEATRTEIKEINTDLKTLKAFNYQKAEINDENPLYAKIIECRQLTNGNWEISDSMFWVAEEHDLIYFIGNKDGPLENHLYVITSSQSSRTSPKRLSKEDFTHTRIIFDPKFQFCIDFQSNLTIPPFGHLNRVVYSKDNPLNINLEPLYMFLNLPDDVKVEDSHEYYDKNQILGPTPQLFEYKLKSGELIYGFLFKPEFMEPGFKYPVLLEVYGGPEVQLVTKSFKDLRSHRRHLIASEGYIVVGFDSRGSKHRGVEFERHIYKRLGQIEIDDQVEALQWLAENTGFIDMNRVAIHGWSYGGYLSLMALAKRPDIFKCSIAGAPVTNWFLYDTGYTERYMGLPSENEENYRLSNVLTYIKNFPNEYNRLLIIHGLMDENVHFSHTAQLIQGLVMVGKPYSLNVYPYERHSLKKMHSSEHYEATLIHYLQQNL